MKVACIQTEPRMLDKGANVHIMCEWIERTMNMYPDIQLIVFPELATTGYQCGKYFEALAEDVNDSTSFSIHKIAEYAKKYKIHVIYGLAEKETKEDIETREEKTRLYNAQVLIDQEGTVIGTYRKVHLFDTEKEWFTPGDTYRVFDTAIGKLGLFICYDASFPEVARILTLQGADILINSTNWEKPYQRDMNIYMQARALENTIYLICCNRIGTDLNLSFFGESCILDPLGVPIQKAEKEIEEVLVADIDYDRMRYLRNNYYTMLQERRESTYL